MTFEVAKAALLESHLAAGLKLVEEQERFAVLSDGRSRYSLSEADIQAYADEQELRAEFRFVPSRASICSANYREHVVRPVDPIRGRFVRSDQAFLFGDPDGDAPRAEIGPASDIFINSYRCNPDFLVMARRRYSAYDRGGDHGDRTIWDLYPRPLTIKLYNLGRASVEEASKFAEALINSCLFEFSYLKRVILQLMNEWPAPARLRGAARFTYGERYGGKHLPFPRAHFNPDLVRFYQLGMSSDIPVLQFLAFYQVLEYFFVAISDDLLYQKLAKRINDPKFSATPRLLDRVIQEVTDHRRTSDETEMLKAVLSRYTEPQEIIDFITEYQGHLGERLYTKRQSRFGVESTVTLQVDQVIAGIAQIVKTVRNALVHSSDRYDRKERHVPFSESSRIVELEVPLVQFLAEKVIIASAAPWDHEPPG